MTSWLHDIYMVSRCYSLVAEEETRRGMRFELLVGARVDLLWLSPPPLHLAHGHGVLIPDGQDWGGLNDRWAIMDRHFAGIWFGRWRAVTQGDFLQQELPRIPPESWLMHEQGFPLLNPEIFLARAFDAEGKCHKLSRVKGHEPMRITEPCCPSPSSCSMRGRANRTRACSCAISSCNLSMLSSACNSAFLFQSSCLFFGKPFQADADSFMASIRALCDKRSI